MRSYRIYGVKQGSDETYVDTVYSAEEAKQVHSQMKSQGYWDEIVARDALGGRVVHRDLRTGKNLLQAA